MRLKPELFLTAFRPSVKTDTAINNNFKEFEITVGFSQRLKGMNIKGFNHILLYAAKA
jgi:hypothetical protein